MSIVFSEWGIEGARKFDAHVGAIVIVDVLSFSTCVDIAVGRGAKIYPFAYADHSAAARFALTIGAELAAQRGGRESRFSLSPASLFAIPQGARLVLPSPNGSSISAAIQTAPVLAGCLRNARAVAGKAIDIARGSPIAVIPAGERWPSGDLRPAIEDLIGAGAIIHALGLPCSPEAEIARQAFLGARAALLELLRGCVSGQELIQRGYPADVEIAAALNASAATPVLLDGAYGG
jgi:2-phosphosulfolactate phosphatase